jgi:hypothetical protein
MGKAAGAMAVVFMLGGGAMTLLSGIFGVHAEAAALAFVGVSLAGTGQLLNAMAHKQQKLGAKPSQARQPLAS